VQIDELFCIEDCEQAVLDFRAATEVSKFQAKQISGTERPPGMGLRSGIGSNGVIPSFLSFCLSLFLSFSYISFVRGDRG